ncbi:MAG: right-handed parallel beta-helix repeat-containing protein [Kiritimatiellales bacterium]|nr:right-handed parallel beta-helix repeat-containing protein [Kiritimatiellales bacterium]
MNAKIKNYSWFGLVVCLCSAATAREFHVSPEGSDVDPGSEKAPLQTVQAAADRMNPDDTCIIHGGTYRETVRLKTSGEDGRPIRFVAAKGEKVVFDGRERIKGGWEPHKGNILRTRTAARFVQLFADDQMLIEARWPNMKFEDRFTRKGWARAATGSAHGKMVCKELAQTGIDWTGAQATLNVAHQFWSWSLPVTQHEKGSDTLVYPQELGSTVDRYKGKDAIWADDYFFLTGKLEALDAPNEWFLDKDAGMLYIRQGKEKTQLEYKARDYAFEVKKCDYIELSGIHFFAATFIFENCNHCTVENCRLLYPSFTRDIPESVKNGGRSASTYMQGDHNTVRYSYIAYANNAGLLMDGSGNLCKNCIVHDINWLGSLNYPSVRLFPARGSKGGLGKNTIRRCTLYDNGNAILHFNGKNSVAEYNHVYNGGLLCKDVSLVYTQQPTTEGSVIRYNWVHGCNAPGFAKGKFGGLGIRGDDQTRGLSVHHNVVWDCGMAGIIVKGDRNRIYNNTVFDISSGEEIMMPTIPEPVKAWRKQHDLLQEQNADCEIFNNAGHIICDRKGARFPVSDRCSHNYAEEPQLKAPDKMDFRPAATSGLMDAGREVAGITDGFKVKAPDIGAYEQGGDFWIPGADWTP